MDALVALGELMVDAAVQVAGIFFDILEWVVGFAGEPERKNSNGNSQS